MAKRYWNMMRSIFTAANPNTHVNPRRGNSKMAALTPALKVKDKGKLITILLHFILTSPQVAVTRRAATKPLRPLFPIGDKI